MRLYLAPFSTNVERVSLALAHKGVEAEPVVISSDDRSLVEQVSGQSLVPVLEDDGIVMTMAAALDRFEALLAGRDHLMGDAFSAADCAAFPFLKYALRRELDDDELFHRVLDDHQQLSDDHPRLAAWIERVGARDVAR